MTQKPWLWQLQDWPQFHWDKNALAPMEARFLQMSGQLTGTWRHLSETDQLELRVDWLTEEAFETSAIEGEILNEIPYNPLSDDNSVLMSDNQRSGPAEAGIAEMMVDLYQTSDKPLLDSQMFEWHRMIMNGRRDVDNIGQWRSHTEPMQVVSGAAHEPKIHYEAPPSSSMNAEMMSYVAWFNDSHELPALTRAGLAHLYFVCIHPYEDGNGRIGRALAEKSLAQSLGQPSLIALSQLISKNRKNYYEALQAANYSLDITDWLIKFGQMILEAQKFSEQKLIRLIDKAKMFDRLSGHLNHRQEKALLRLFRAEPDGFKGSLSAANYRQITSTTVQTATRDLADLVTKGALTKTGERRYTRYFLNIPELS